MTPTILSTKILTPTQKQRLLAVGLTLVEYNAVVSKLLKIEPVEKVIKNAIFSSQNAVKAVLKAGIGIENCFCVGGKTARMLRYNAFCVVEVADSAAGLAAIITKSYGNNTFVFFCGDQRRNELPDALRQQAIAFEEKIVYTSRKNPKKFNRSFDGILFFSPSGVEAFVCQNSLENTPAFCIGNTTATAARPYAQEVTVAAKPTVENVLAQAVLWFVKR